MITIPDYEVLQKIHEGTRTVVYRGQKQPEKQPVIIKLLNSEYPTLEEITRLRHEYKVIQDVKSEGVVKAYSLNKYRNGLALILEDFGGKSLNKTLAARKLEIIECLQIGIALTDILGDLHKFAIIHKDIKPSNIIVNFETGQVKLGDFGLSSRLSLETQTIGNPNLLEGTLAYIAPEQTGRMNRLVDYRSDFYSLGVTLYEMLTGELPFIGQDPLELVHCHIAKQPIPPHQKQQIPTAVSQIVMKLLAKNAEERYQSAAGLKFDLENCLQQIQNTGKINDFIIAQRDHGNQLLIPQKLYGREQEVATLMDAFWRVSQGATEMMLVSGYSGIGKTSIVNEVHKPIVAARGYFIAGKFDQLKRDIPYAALIQSFQELIRQILTEDDQKIAIWRQKILVALGDNAQVIIDVIPEVESIIGAQPQVPILGSAESENRFNRVFQQFIHVFCQPEHPLVIFLDDLQWADSASLKLIKLLITDDSSQYLFLIGAYRDNEVSPTHRLVQTLQNIRQTNTIINEITITPLLFIDVQQLIIDTLKPDNIDINNIQLLVELIYNKTQGNPFFLTQLLKSLYSENLLVYQVYTDSWCWDIQEIQTVGITEFNIVELVTQNIRKLPPTTQRVLQLAACIGNQFNLEVLATVYEDSEIVTSTHLWSALQAGLILPLSSNYKIPLALLETDGLELRNVQITYKFLHDRVQQAAYSLIPENERKSTHLQIGQILLRNSTVETQKENIFVLVNQLNFGTDLLTNQEEKNNLAQLNLIAGQKAKASTAYEAAVKYLNIALELIQYYSWENSAQQPEQWILQIYLETAEAEYLNGNLDQALLISNQGILQVNDLLEKLKYYQVQLKIYLAKSEINTVLDMGQQILKMLDVSLVESQPENLDIEQLANLPPMTDPYKLAAIEVLILMWAPACFAESPIALPMLYTMIELSRQYGNSPPSIYAFANYGTITAWLIPDIDLAYQLGQLSLRVLEKLNAKNFKSKAILTTNINIFYKKQHIKTTINNLYEAIESALEVGDIEFASHAANFYCSHLFFVAKHLDSVAKSQSDYIDFITKLEQQHPLYLTKICAQAVDNLRNKSIIKTSLMGEIFNEEEAIPYLQGINNLISLFYTYFYKLYLCYFFAEYDQAIEFAKTAQQYAGFVKSEIIFTQHNWFYSLTMLASSRITDIATREEYLKQVNENQQQMKYWAEHAPMNYQHKYDLVEAEKARILNQPLLAMELYDRAIAGANNSKYIQDEALAYELAAKFYLALGRTEIAQTYMTKAQYDYIAWGAIAKVKDLESKYADIILVSKKDSTFDPKNSISLVSSSSSSQRLDINTIIKASQTLSSEIMLDNLLTKLMTIVIENAGAEIGFLILKQQEKLYIAAQKTLDNSDIIVCQSHLEDKNKQLPTSIINYVIRTKEDVILNDASDEGRFMKDAYIINKKPKSVLCTKIIYQGEIFGLLYLENNLAVGAFTPERLEILRILSSQAAISIKNAQLYENLNQLNQSFSRFVPRQFLQLLNKESIVDVQIGDNIQQEMSILFSDIRDFTKLSETMTPEDNFKFINSYLSRMEPAIIENQGFIDKYIGDAIMALFSRGADDAVKAAISMLLKVNEYNLDRQNMGYPSIQIGIGINSGSLMLGTVGGINRMDGTVISDAVNLASRIEGLTKLYGVSLLISHHTFARLENPNQYKIRLIDRVQVKGKSEIVSVFEVFDADIPEICEVKLSTRLIFEEALLLYNQDNLTKAALRFQDCLNLNPGDKVSRLYLERCQQ
ncbi:MAG: GAF domain-containing protein [Nostocales cyanobacterium]|nr:MAG: GAF domain-containing protein [Nostocales cyanobacterium]